MAKTMSKIGTNPLDFLASERGCSVDLGEAVPVAPTGPSPAEVAEGRATAWERRCRALDTDLARLRGEIEELHENAARMERNRKAELQAAGLQGMAAGFVLTLLLFGIISTFAG